MKPDSVTEKIMEYVKKISARVSELWWSFTQKIWKFKQKGFSYFNRGNVSDGYIFHPISRLKKSGAMEQENCPGMMALTRKIS